MSSLFFRHVSSLVMLVCVANLSAQNTRKHLLERIDDTGVIQLYADGFDALSLEQKLLCYHLGNAAIAGRDIFIDQKFAHSLAIRNLLEELFMHRQGMAEATRQEIVRYTKLFWLNNGIHDHLTTRKRLLELDITAFRAALAVAMKAGASLPSAHAVAELYDHMANPKTFVSCTNKSPDDGGDPLVESSNNLYLGVTSKDLEGFEERYPLNSRVVKVNGRATEQVYRIGDPSRGLSPGLYAKQLAAVNKHLQWALSVAPPKTGASLKHLIEYYKTGDPKDWWNYNVAWVADKNNTVDGINGFVEVYLDARGMKGGWEAVVSFVNPAMAKDIKRLATEAQWFEDRMPWDPKFRKKKVMGITANAITVIMETGDSGPMSPIGINLPNEADIRRDYGSKSVNLSNVVAGYNSARSGGGALAEFVWTPAEIDRAKKYAAHSGDVHTNLHEVVGHASGQIMPEIKNPAQRLGRYYSTLEEGRADLIGLYWIIDPKLQKMGIIPNADAALAEYEGYARNALLQLRRVPVGGKVEEDHMRNRQLIVHWMIANSDAVKVEKRDGKTFYRVTSAAGFRAASATLLAEIMRIKATGDFKAGKHLVDTYGTKVDPVLHQEVLGRLKSLNLVSSSGFVMPELQLVRGSDGVVSDVTVHYPMDLAAQMLRFSGKRK
jgi:dipeptidyl-peptidase-3